MRIIIIIKNQLELKNMESQNNSSCTSFFESVAHHNLERFHSESIAWIFKTFPNSAKYFIKSIHDDISQIEEIEFDKEYCWAESNQIDILLKYSYKSKKYQIIIENKIKASEHSIGVEKLVKDLSNINDDSNILLSREEKNYLKKAHTLSQTQFYYLREKIEQVKNIVDAEFKKRKNQKIEEDLCEIFEKYVANNSAPTNTTINNNSSQKECIEYLNKKINTKYCRYVYLKPSKINPNDVDDFNERFLNDFDFEKLNDWNRQLGKNPWITITYKDLVKIFKKQDAFDKNYCNKQVAQESIVVANAYVKYLDDNFKGIVYLDEFNKNNEYAIFEYFKLLFALVKSKLDLNDQISEYIKAGSANGGMPLFAFYKTIDLNENYTFFTNFKNKKIVINPSINVGLQVQGENLKYYVSVDEKAYDEIEVNDQEKYTKFVKFILKGISINVEDFENGDKGFHSNKTKTFYSRSYKIKGFIDQSRETRSISSIANEILNRVQYFIANSDVSKLIAEYEAKRS